jgi:hypothetical protein
MKNNEQIIKEKLELVIKIITGVADKRKDFDAIMQLSLIKLEMGLEDLKGLMKHLNETKDKLLNLIDEIKYTIDAEERYVLFPMPDIKKETYELGKNYMRNFFSWLKPEDNFSPEELIKIFEEEKYRLEEAKNILEKIKPSPFLKDGENI